MKTFKTGEDVIWPNKLRGVVISQDNCGELPKLTVRFHDLTLIGSGISDLISLNQNEQILHHAKESVVKTEEEVQSEIATHIGFKSFSDIYWNGLILESVHKGINELALIYKLGYWGDVTLLPYALGDDCIKWEIRNQNS